MERPVAEHRERRLGDAAVACAVIRGGVDPRREAGVLRRARELKRQYTRAARHGGEHAIEVAHLVLRETDLACVVDGARDGENGGGGDRPAAAHGKYRQHEQRHEHGEPHVEHVAAADVVRERDVQEERHDERQPARQASMGAAAHRHRREDEPERDGEHFVRVRAPEVVRPQGEARREHAWRREVDLPRRIERAAARADVRDEAPRERDDAPGQEREEPAPIALHRDDERYADQHEHRERFDVHEEEEDRCACDRRQRRA